jgi:hypothetical protein
MRKCNSELLQPAADKRCAQLCSTLEHISHLRQKEYCEDQRIILSPHNDNPEQPERHPENSMNKFDAQIGIWSNSQHLKKTITQKPTNQPHTLHKLSTNLTIKAMFQGNNVGMAILDQQPHNLQLPILKPLIL